MRVLMLAWEYPPHVVGGMGKHVLDLAPALGAVGVEVHVLTPLLRGGAAHEVTPEGVHVHRIEPPHMEDYGFVTFALETSNVLEHAAHALQAEIGGFDLVHAHDWLAASAAVALKHAWRRPLVATIHATERGRGQGFLSANGHSERINQLEWRLTYEAWRLIACSRFMAQQIHDYFGTPLDKIDVVPNGIYVRPDPFASDEERLVFRRRFAQDDQPLAYYVGRIVYEKGLHILLDAWPRVLATLPNACLVIAGAGSYLPSLVQRAQELGIAAQVTFAGFIPAGGSDQLYHAGGVGSFPSL